MNDRMAEWSALHSVELRLSNLMDSECMSHATIDMMRRDIGQLILSRALAHISGSQIPEPGWSTTIFDAQGTT